MASGMMTYCEGFLFKVVNNVTKGEFYTMLKNISTDLNTMYNNETKESAICLKPEGITEGGILFTGLGYGNCQETGRNRGLMYKTMRLGVRHTTGDSQRWPWIDDEELLHWENSNDIILHVKVDRRLPEQIEEDPDNVYYGSKYGTYLKAFDWAPMWTKKELDIFKRHFEATGKIRVYDLDNYDFDYRADRNLDNNAIERR